MNNVYEEIEALRSDHSHGASQLTRQSLIIMQDAINSYNAANQLEFLKYMRSIAEGLVKARITMVSIRNIISRFMYLLIKECSKSDINLKALQTWSIQTASNLINTMEEARINSIFNAADFIPHGARLITCSYSSTIIAALKKASAIGKSFQLMILESRFGEYKYGEMTAAQLAGIGIASRVFADEQTKFILSQSDMVLLGADSVLPNGSVINGYPSLYLARSAAENEPPVPVYSICESIKFCPSNTIHLEEGFDLIPAQLITGKITEKPFY